MLINYKNLTIRNATGGDAELLTKWWNDGQVMAHAGFPNGLGKTISDVKFELQSDTDDTYRRLIIERDNIPIGEMNYRNKRSGIAEIGIKICETSQQNKGYGKLLISLLISAMFDMGYIKIVLDTNLNNLRAQHVYESLGFKKVKVNINSWTNQLGELQSSVDYELNVNDFVKVKI